MTHNRFYIMTLCILLSASISLVRGMDRSVQSTKTISKQTVIDRKRFLDSLNPREKATKALFVACFTPKISPSAVQQCIDEGANVNAISADGINYTPLHFSAVQGNLTVMKVLYKNNADPNLTTSSGYYPIHLAAKEGHLDVVKYLINEKNIPVNLESVGQRITPLSCSVLSNKLDLLDFLIKNDANVNHANCDGITSIYYSVFNGFHELTKFLIESKADINISTKNGMTPFHTAICRNAPLWVLELLLNSGAHIEAKTKEGFTPLHLAVEHKLSVEKIEFLLKKGANPYAADSSEKMPLYIASLQKRSEVIRILAQYSDINAPLDNLARTALHIAAETGDIDTIKILMELRAKHTYAEGKYMAIDYANKNGHHHIVALMNQYLNADKIAQELSLEEDKKNILAQQAADKNRKRNLKKKAKKQEKKAILVKTSQAEVSIVVVPQEKNSSTEDVATIEIKNQPIVLKQNQIVLDTEHTNNFGSLDYGTNRKIFVYPDHNRTLSFGAYFKGADGVSFIPSGAHVDNVGSQAAVNHLKHAIYSKHVLSKMVPKDVHHNFPTTFEEQFGHLSCVELTDTRITEQRKAYLKKQYEISENIDDFWLEFVIGIPATIESASFPEKKALKQEPQGVIEIRGLKKDLTDSQMLVVHRFYRKNK